MFATQVAINGLLVGGLYALMALGLSLIWGVMDVINIAHGAFIMLGAYTTYWLFQAGIDPLIFLAGGAAWLVTMTLFRFAGLSSLVMGFAFPVAAWWRMKSQHYGSEVLWGTIALAFLILARHRSNIARMLAGTEPRVGRRRHSDQSHGA